MGTYRTNAEVAMDGISCKLALHNAAKESRAEGQLKSNALLLEALCDR